MKLQRSLLFLLGVSLVGLASAAGAVAASVLILPVEGADASAGQRLHGELLSAFGGSESLDVVTAEPLVGPRSADRFRKAAERAGAEAVVAAILENGSLALELRSAHSGGVITTWSLDAADAKLAPAVRETEMLLAAQLTPNTDAANSEAGDESASVLAGRNEGPMQIRSDLLDVATKDGERHLVFRRNVVVEQGEIELHTKKLDAFYKEGDSQPDRLVAQGDVEVFQGDRVAYCDRATYLRSDQKVVCTGHARLVQGCDVVRGEQLEFDLEREHFRVVGAASVVIAEGEDACPKTNVEAGS